MNKLKALLITSAMLLTFASCGAEKSSSDTGSKDNSSSEADTTASAEKETEETTESDEPAETEKETEPEEDTTAEKDDDKKDFTDIDINDYITAETTAPALWKATDPDSGNELYLLGTIHVVSEDKFSMPDYLLDVYEKSDGIAVEYDIRKLEEISVAQELLMQMVYTDGTKISDHISEEAYEAGKEALSELSMYASALDVYKPGFWVSQIETLAMTSFKNLSTEGVDSRFLEMAAEDGKDIVSIETLEIQSQAMTAYSDEYADYCLRQAPEDLEKPEKIAQGLGELYDAWAAGDMVALEAISNDTEDIPEEYLDDYAAYNDIMIYKRNEGMADKAAEFLENGDNYFFMVGALHFAGDKGVTALLEDKGYTIERLY